MAVKFRYLCYWS